MITPLESICIIGLFLFLLLATIFILAFSPSKPETTKEEIFKEIR